MSSLIVKCRLHESGVRQWNECFCFKSLYLCFQARASDLDSGVFGKLSYSIVGGNDDGRFYINSTTGNISNAMVLDREQQNLYNLVVEATDGGPNNR